MNSTENGLDAFEALFAEAEAELKKQEIPEDWGELRRTDEGERLLARYLGSETLPPFDDIYFRFVEYPDGAPFHLKYKFQLSEALKDASVGDIVGLVRGADKDIGKPNPMETWEGWSRPCDKPLAVSAPAADNDIPF